MLQKRSKQLYYFSIYQYLSYNNDKISHNVKLDR